MNGTELLVEHSKHFQEATALFADSSEWESLIAALDEMNSVLFILDNEQVNVLLCVVEEIYRRGYKRGKAEKDMPVFMVGEE